MLHGIKEYLLALSLTVEYGGQRQSRDLLTKVKTPRLSRSCPTTVEVYLQMACAINGGINKVWARSCLMLNIHLRKLYQLIDIGVSRCLVGGVFRLTAV